MRVNELTLSQAVLPSLAKAGIQTVEQLAEKDLGGLLRQPEFRSGVELYELIRELHRHGLTPFAARASPDSVQFLDTPVGSRHGGHESDSPPGEGHRR